MSNETAAFFDALGRRGHEPLLATVTGRAQFDVVDSSRTDRWLVAISKGDITVSHKRGTADCTIRGSEALFDDLASGRTNATAAVLRGALLVSGDLELFFAIQRIFPGPPRKAPSNRDVRSSQ